MASRFPDTNDVPVTPETTFVRVPDLLPGMMRVRLMSHYPDVVVCLLTENDWQEYIDNNLNIPLIARNPIILTFPDDDLYREIAGWSADALACGLLHSVSIRR